MTTTTTNIRFGNYTMTEQEYETNASAIATAIWGISTNNGRDLDHDDWNSHLQNCHAAVANTYTDGITQAAWHNAALGKVVMILDDDTITCDICDRPTDPDDINTTEDGYTFCTSCGDTHVRWTHDDRQGESYAYRY